MVAWAVVNGPTNGTVCTTTSHVTYTRPMPPSAPTCVVTPSVLPCEVAAEPGTSATRASSSGVRMTTSCSAPRPSLSTHSS